MRSLTYAFKKEWYNVILLILPFVAIPFIWDLVPDQMATHWNLQGEADDYSSKTFGLLFLPCLNIGLYLLNLNLQKIDPKQRITIGQKPIPVIRTLLVFFLFAIYCWMIGIALGYNISSGWIFPAIAILFIILGNYMRTIQPNYFIGVRVPWTLENEDNWRHTHKLASWLWVAGGLLLLLLYPFVDQLTYGYLFGITVVILALIPIGYSFYYYKKSKQS